MQGKIKWFSDQKGYGFIFGDDGQDYYYNVQSINGINLPKNGDIVNFHSSPDKKGLRATDVTLVERSQSNNKGKSRSYDYGDQSNNNSYNKKPRSYDHNNHSNNDNRVECTGCGKKITPRVIMKSHREKGFFGQTYYKQEPDYSVCPFCGKVQKSFGLCFITSAACNYKGLSDNCYELEKLRNFRDNYLMITEQGRDMVNHYYDIAPDISKKLIKKDDFIFVWNAVTQCINAIESGNNKEAVNIYKSMVLSLQEKFGKQDNV